MVGERSPDEHTGESLPWRECGGAVALLNASLPPL